MNLVMLELRKHRVLVGGMLLVALLWAAWMARLVLTGEPLTTLAVNVGFLFALAPVGLLVPIVLARALSGEATGPLAFLLTSPRRGLAHVSARFGVALATLAVYYGVLVAVSAWVAQRSGIVYDAWLPLATWAYGLAAWIAPVVILGIVYGLVVAAYRPGRGGQIVAVAAVFGVFKAWSWLGDQAMGRLDFLPKLPLPKVIVPREVAPFLGMAPADLDLQKALQPLFDGVPTAPVFVGLLVTLALLAVAVRLWEEAEWA